MNFINIVILGGYSFMGLTLLIILWEEILDKKWTRAVSTVIVLICGLLSILWIEAQIGA